MAKPALTFPFKSDVAHYESGACIVYCFDFRIKELLDAFVAAEGIENPDYIKIAGGAKSLANDADPAVRKNILWQINASNQLHGTKRLIISNHTKCGAYGLKVDENVEYIKLEADLTEAELYLRATIPASMTIEKYI